MGRRKREYHARLVRWQADWRDDRLPFVITTGYCVHTKAGFCYLKFADVQIPPADADWTWLQLGGLVLHRSVNAEQARAWIAGGAFEPKHPRGPRRPCSRCQPDLSIRGSA